MIACYEWGAYLGDDGLKKGIKCMISGYTRANGNAVMNKGKICGQYVTSVLAKRMAIKSGFEEALMLDPQGYVAEGTGENIFVVKKDVVRTPPTSAAILSGITRDTAIQLLREQGDYRVDEVGVSRAFELAQAQRTKADSAAGSRSGTGMQRAPGGPPVPAPTPAAPDSAGSGSGR